MDVIDLFCWKRILLSSILVISTHSIMCSQKSFSPSTIQSDNDYIFLEKTKDPNIIKWLKEQGIETSSQLEQIPRREVLIQSQQEFDANKGGTISKLRFGHRKTPFYLKSINESNSNALFYLDLTTHREHELFRSDQFKSNDSLTYLIGYIQPSYDEKKVIVCMSTQGKESMKVIVVNVENKSFTYTGIDTVRPTIGGMFWTPDNQSFFYPSMDLSLQGTKLNMTNIKNRIYRLNNKDDTEFFSRKNNLNIQIKPEDFPIVYVNYPSDKYCIGTIYNTAPGFEAYSLPIEYVNSQKRTWKPLFTREELVKDYFQKGDSIYYLTSKNAANFKICKTSILQPNFADPIIVAGEREDAVIKNMALTQNGVFYTTITNGVVGKLFYKPFGRTEQEIKLPFNAGYIRTYSLGVDSDYISFTLQGWLHPPSKYTYDYVTGQIVVDENLEKLYPPVTTKEIQELVVEELEVPAKDGELIPLSLVYNKDLQKDGKASVIMRGYGAYGSSLPPVFDYGFLLPALEGGIYAVAHVRGGGEKGDRWYKAGYKSTKSNTWNDFIACSEHLISQNYTSKGKMAIWSGSAGGILIGRAMTERPDLFGATIIDNGFLNPSRHTVAINGKDTTYEFGSVEKEDEVEFVKAMDAFLHVKENTNYPASLIRVSMNDSRVDPFMSVKFGVKLKNSTSSKDPILLYPDFNRGHSYSLSAEKEEYIRMADAISFAYWQTGHPDYQLQKEK